MVGILLKDSARKAMYARKLNTLEQKKSDVLLNSLIRGGVFVKSEQEKRIKRFEKYHNDLIKKRGLKTSEYTVLLPSGDIVRK